jgi:hypothetical protein
MRQWWLGWSLVLVVSVSLLGCAQVDEIPAAALFGTAGPKAAVGQTLAALVDHDLARSRTFVCDGFGDPSELPIPLGIRLGMGGLPQVTTGELLTAVALDFSAISATEQLVDPEHAIVTLDGPVTVRYDLQAVRALAEGAAGGTDPAAVDTLMAVLGDGEFVISLKTAISVDKVGGRWLICALGGGEG